MKIFAPAKKLTALTAGLLAGAIASAATIEPELKIPVARPRGFQIEHLRPPSLLPNDPVRLFGLRIPFRVAPLPESAQDRIEFHYSAGNAWNTVTGFEYPTGYKVYGADGVIRSGQLRYTHALGKGFEGELGINFAALIGGCSNLDAPVCDRFIEDFHLLNPLWNDPFQRVAHGIDQARLTYQDKQGRELEVLDGELHFGTLNLGVVKYIELVRGDHVLLTLNVGTYGSVPLNRLIGSPGIGAASGLAGTWQPIDSFSLTSALGGRVQLDKTVKIIPGSLDFLDYPVSGGYAFLLGGGMDGRDGSRVSGGVEFVGDSPILSSGMTGEKPIQKEEFPDDDPDFDPRISHSRTYHGMTDFTHYASLFFSFRPGRFRTERFGTIENSPTFTIYVQEDWIPLPGNDEAGRGLLIDGGNNNIDFGMGVKLDWPF